MLLRDKEIISEVSCIITYLHQDLLPEDNADLNSKVEECQKLIWVLLIW